MPNSTFKYVVQTLTVRFMLSFVQMVKRQQQHVAWRQSPK